MVYINPGWGDISLSRSDYGDYVESIGVPGNGGRSSYRYVGGAYYDSSGRQVSWQEVMENYITPNAWIRYSSTTAYRQRRANVGYGKYQLEVRYYNEFCSEFNFVQTVNLYDRDGWEHDLKEYNMGFLYLEDDIKWYKNFKSRIGDADVYFEDAPSANKFDAFLTVFGKFNGEWIQIETYEWGYNIMNGEYNDYFRTLTDPNSNRFIESGHQNNINWTLKNWNK